MPVDLSPEAWAQIRHDYEHTDRPIADICAEHGISDGTLRDRRRRWNWTPRHKAIPREGPPPLPAPPHREIADIFQTACSPHGATRSAGAALPDFAALHPGYGAHLRGDERRELPLQIELPLTPTPDPSPQGGGTQAESAAPVVPDHVAQANADPATIGPRLQGAVAQLLPAIEATLRRLTAGPLAPREMEQSARALGTLMRTLRELNALAGQHPAHVGDDDDPVPVDMDEFREELARRINAFVAARREEQGEEDAASGAAADADAQP